MLVLPIKKQWFDMIISGEKKEEYREIKPYNQMFFEVTFTDSPYWENFIEKQLYMDIPKEQEASVEDGDKGSNKKGKRTKTEDEK